jgi:hypothetical protein
MPQSTPAPQPPPLFEREEVEEEPPEWIEEGPRASPPPIPGRAGPTAFPTETATPAAAQVAAMDAILEQQRLLAGQFEMVRAMKAAGSSAVPPLPEVGPGAVTSTAGGRSLRRALREDLAGSPGLRRAVLLREVLGEPPGMQRGRLNLPRR